MKKSNLLILGLAAMALCSCGGGNSSSSRSATSSSGSGRTPYSGDALPYTPYEPQIPAHEKKTNTETFDIDYDELKVNAPAQKLADDFAFGADLSIVAEIEENGGIYYNEDGEEEDIFSVLAKDGVNYCRLRLWNNPYSVDGEPYGGGTNDLARDIYLARRAKAAGMKLLLDFHYSDHWADPAKFHAPKLWAETTHSGNIAKTLGTYTYRALKAFKEAGVTVDSVQIGNESNNGLAGYDTLSALDLMASMVKEGVLAAKDCFPSIKTLVHLTNVKSPASVYQFLDAVEDEGVDYDIVGLSYYPYFHGTLANLKNVMDHIHDEYGKPSWVVETSYGFTDETSEYCSNTFNKDNHENPGGYLCSIQGQATQMADLVSTLSTVKESYGQGVFYWEPSWLPVPGSTWASKAGQFYNDHGIDGTEEEIAVYTDKSCLPAWCNQGWFSYRGKAHPGASVYKHIKLADQTATETVVEPRATKLSVNVNLLKGVILPDTAQVVTSFDALRHRPVVWNEEEVQAITADGEYVVHGKLDNQYDIVCNVVAETNYIPDYSFEEQADGEEVPVGGDWSVESNIENAARIEAKNEGNIDGEKYFHWFSDAENEFTLTTQITVANPDDYDLSTYIMAGDLKSDYEEFHIWYQIGDADPVNVSIIDELHYGWGILEITMQRVVVEHLVITEENTVVQFGLHVKYKGSAWGHNDLWSFAKHKEAKAEYVANGALEDGDLAEQTTGAIIVDPWIANTDSQGLAVGSENIGNAESKKNFKWWMDGGVNFRFGVHQNIAGLEEGTYGFSFILLSEASTKYETFEVYFLVDGVETTVFDVKAHYDLGWHAGDAGDKIFVSGLEVPADATITIGIRVSALGGAWGRMTDFKLGAAA